MHRADVPSARKRKWRDSRVERQLSTNDVVGETPSSLSHINLSSRKWRPLVKDNKWVMKESALKSSRDPVNTGGFNECMVVRCLSNKVLVWAGGTTEANTERSSRRGNEWMKSKISGSGKGM